jgi:hypothetical protein
MTKQKFLSCFPSVAGGFLIAATCCVSSSGAEREVRPIPPPGLAIGDTERAELTGEVNRLDDELAALRHDLQSKPALLRLLSDIEIFKKAVRYALDHNEFHNPTNEVPAARALLRSALERAAQLRSGNPSWLSATGLVVRGYVSKIDGSVQPYGLVVPASFSRHNSHRFRLDVWFHGRDEKPSPMFASTTRLTKIGSPCAVSRWAARLAGSLPSITPAYGLRQLRAPALLNQRSS